MVVEDFFFFLCYGREIRSYYLFFFENLVVLV